MNPNEWKSNELYMYILLLSLLIVTMFEKKGGNVETFQWNILFKKAHTDRVIYWMYYGGSLILGPFDKTGI